MQDFLAVRCNSQVGVPACAKKSSGMMILSVKLFLVVNGEFDKLTRLGCVAPLMGVLAFDLKLLDTMHLMFTMSQTECHTYNLVLQLSWQLFEARELCSHRYGRLHAPCLDRGERRWMRGRFDDK